MSDPFEDFDKRWAMQEITELPRFKCMSKRKAQRYLEQLRSMSASAVEQEYSRLSSKHPSIARRAAATMFHALAL